MLLLIVSRSTLRTSTDAGVKHLKVLNLRIYLVTHDYITRHRASTSMHSLTFCVRVMLPERHQWKPTVQAATVMLKTPPPSTASHQPASHAHFPYMSRNFENAPVTRQSQASSARRPRRAFALCRHIAGWTQACIPSNYRVRDFTARAMRALQALY